MSKWQHLAGGADGDGTELARRMGGISERGRGRGGTGVGVSTWRSLEGGGDGDGIGIGIGIGAGMSKWRLLSLSRGGVVSKPAQDLVYDACVRGRTLCCVGVCVSFFFCSPGVYR